MKNIKLIISAVLFIYLVANVGCTDGNSITGTVDTYDSTDTQELIDVEIISYKSETAMIFFYVLNGDSLSTCKEYDSIPDNMIWSGKVKDGETLLVANSVLDYNSNGLKTKKYVAAVSFVPEQGLKYLYFMNSKGEGELSTLE